MFFTQSHKLVVEVVMAKDMRADEDSASRLSSPSTFGGGMPLCPYVKVQLVPGDWFPGAVTHSTKVMKRSDPATFQETFT